MRITAIIVTYNKRAMLEQALAHTLAETVDQVIVVDNASTDDTETWLAGQSDPRLRVLRLAENLGGAGGAHAALSAALAEETPTDWCVIFDDDAWPQPGAFDAFRALKTTLAEDIGVVAAAVFNPDGTVCEMNRPGNNPFWHAPSVLATFLPWRRRGSKLRDLAYEPMAAGVAIDMASFVGFFVRTEAARRSGLPNQALFIYGDDLLYSLKLRRAGWRILFAPSVRFSHDTATLADGGIYHPLWKTYYKCRNAVLVARAAAGPVLYPVALGYYAFGWWRRGRKASTQERRAYYRLVRMGLRDGLAHRLGRNDEAHRIGPT